MSARRTLAAAVSALALAFGAQAATHTAPAQAKEDLTFGGSCDWSTDGQWHWSPSYTQWYRYEGHAKVYGLYYRVYTVASFSNSFNVVIYCG